MGPIKPWHLVVLVIAFILLFGWKNLPNMARSLGESMRVFKKEVDGMKSDSAESDSSTTSTALPPTDDSHPSELPAEGTDGQPRP